MNNRGNSSVHKETQSPNANNKNERKSRSPVRRKLVLEKPKNYPNEIKTYISPDKYVTKVTKLVLKPPEIPTTTAIARSKSSQIYTKPSISRSHKASLSPPSYTRAILIESPRKEKKTIESVSSIVVPPTTNLDSLKTDFLKKKDDREKISNEFKEILNENFIEKSSRIDIIPEDTQDSLKPNEKIAGEKNFKIQKSTSIVKQSNMVGRRTKSAGPVIIPNKKDPNSLSTCKKPKTHDPKITRVYIKEQQIKRKLIDDKAKTEKEVDREEIQKRLKDLRQKSLKLVSNNLQHSKLDKNKFGKENKGISKTITESKKKPYNDMSNNKPTEKIPIVPSTSLLPTKETPTVPLKIIHKPLEIPEFLKLDPNILGKKIGIRRKIETTNHPIEVEKTPEHLKFLEFNKENLGSTKNSQVEQDITKKISVPSASTSNYTTPPVAQTEKELFAEKCLVDDIYKSPVLLSPKEDKLKNDTILDINDYDLKVPDVKLKTPIKLDSEKHEFKNHESPVVNNIPYWLKPSEVQVYPYNFIMAIRKKLDAIANPTLGAVTNKMHHNINHSRGDFAEDKESKWNLSDRSFTNRSSPKKQKLDHDVNIKKSNNILERTTRKLINRHNGKLHKNRAISKSTSSEIMNTNFSSITLHMPESNTTSEVSSIKSEITKHPDFLSSTKIEKNPKNLHDNHKDLISDDYTTIEETSFSSTAHQSPVKQYQQTVLHQEISPLSTENINDLKLQSKIDEKLKGIVLDDHTPQPDQNTKEYFDFQQLLESFNKSLNHVIEMNQQLYSALKNPPKHFADQFSAFNVNQTTAGVATATETAVPAVTTKSAQTSPTAYMADDKKTNLNVKKDQQTSPLIFDQISLDKNDVEENSSIEKSIPSERDSSGSKRFNQLHLNKHTEPESSPDNYSDKFDGNSNNDGDDDRSSVVSHQSTYIITRNSETSIKTNGNMENDITITSHQIQSIMSSSHAPSTRSSSSTITSKHINTEESEIVPILNLKTPKSRRSSTSTIRTAHSENTVLKTFHEKLEDHENNDGNHDLNNTTIGSELYNIFKDYNNQSDLEMTINNSELNLSYSTIGFYDQAIKNETVKSDHLSSLMKIREKAIIDRTRGQIAWLEIQKKKFKEMGKTDEISIIRKKQRALLVRLEKERKEISNIVKDQNFNLLSNSMSISNSNIHRKKSRPLIEINSSTSSSLTIKKSSKYFLSPKNALRCYDIKDSSASVEQLLKKREIELKNRRENVEKLIKWHQRLDAEEMEIKNIEKNLLKFNLNKLTEKNKKINEINEKLKVLKTISSTNSSLNTSVKNNDVAEEREMEQEIVSVSGNKLNKLWYRLTGKKNELKFNLNEIYNITKTDLENLYEEAKRNILNDENHFENLFNDSKLSLNEINLKTPSVISEHNEEESSVTDNNKITPTPNYTDFDPTPNYTEPESDLPSSEMHRTNSVSSKIQTILTSTSTPTLKNSPLNENNDENSTQIYEKSSNDEIDDFCLDKLYLKYDDFNNETSLIENISIPNNFNDISSLNNSNIPENDKKINNDDNFDNTSLQTIINDNDDDDDKIIINDKTIEEISELSSDFIKSNNEENKNSNQMIKNEIEQRLIVLDESLKELNKSFEKLPDELKSPDLSSISSSTSTSIQSSRCSSEEMEIATESNEYNKNDETSIAEPSNNTIISAAGNVSNSSTSTIIDNNQPILLRNKNINETFPISAANRIMPDIINEAEVLRRQQKDLKPLIGEQAVVTSTTSTSTDATSFLYLREIPNKPPPPYVPPAVDSQFASVFPSESRIKDIVLRQTAELYEIEFLNNTEVTTLPTSIKNENITNIYERIILDVCSELILDLKPIQPENENSFHKIPVYKNHLFLFNPPDRLEAIQNYILKKIMKLLAVENRGQRPSPTLNSTQTIFMQNMNYRKRDLVDEILITELAEDEQKWLNFDLEECEVKNTLTEEIWNILLEDSLNDIETAIQSKNVH